MPAVLLAGVADVAFTEAITQYLVLTSPGRRSVPPCSGCSVAAVALRHRLDLL
ncbi:hypothetical protein [Actinomadura sp. CNU-125]|uniref:hypothetical protein n=1 Tax=Actinomadura sp. CNU-125 TaxID=1904961 RepID=UPI001301648D|nr:hypothetical protein [Actinomadura sp. CNU-125]